MIDLDIEDCNIAFQVYEVVRQIHLRIGDCKIDNNRSIKDGARWRSVDYKYGGFRKACERIVDDIVKERIYYFKVIPYEDLSHVIPYEDLSHVIPFYSVATGDGISARISRYKRWGPYEEGTVFHSIDYIGWPK